MAALVLLLHERRVGRPLGSRRPRRVDGAQPPPPRQVPAPAPEGTASVNRALHARRLADHRARAAEDRRLRVRKDRRDVEAARALHVHEKRVGDCTKRLSLCFRFSSDAEGWRRSRTMVFGGVQCSWGPVWVSRVNWRLGRAARSLGRLPGCSWRLGGRRSLSSGRAAAAAAWRAPTRSVALRRPALAVGHGVVGRGGRARARARSC